MQANHQYTEAFTIVDSLLTTYPQEAKLLEKKAELLFQMQQYDDYLTQRSSLTKKQQKKAQRSYLIAQMRTGQVSEALATIIDAINNNPTSDWYQLQGQAFALQGQIKEAEKSYDQALQLDPENQDALTNKAILFADSGRLYESLDLFDAWLAKHPDDYLLRYNKWTVLSDLWYQQRNVIGTGSFSYYGDALRHFEKAYRLNPNYQNTAIWLGITYLDLGQYKKAHQALDTVLSADPEAYDARYYKAKAFTAEENYSEAKATYQQLLKLNPDYELAQQELILLEKQENNNIVE